jgi:hypothetical protein
VVSPAGVEHAAGLIEGLSLADLVAEEYGLSPDPDRSARRSARGKSLVVGAAEPAADDLVAARLAELERTVRQLEHALSARVATERAIGVLAERTGTGPREAFETLRRDARASGRPVTEIAREVLATLSADAIPGEDIAGAPVPVGREPLDRPGSDGAPAVAAADGRR